jgi:hypothetical protein
LILVGSPEQQALYRAAFARNCLTLLVRAHLRLAKESLQNAEEPHITGEIIREAQDIIEDNEAEAWMDHIEIKDDPPQNVGGRFGKKRPRIDFEFVQVGRGRRPRFHIEAKRLYRSDSVNEYFGDGGLLMFVEGTYAAEWPSAAMLGYVQSDDCAVWLNRLDHGIGSRLIPLRVYSPPPNWVSARWSGDGLDEAMTSIHDRSHKNLELLSIHHLLLAFC